jgi:4-hydroxy-3-methylbut-2-enyl diphosphate reductase
MQIKVAGCSGFCFGVKRAINIAKKALLKDKPKIYSLGPIIHNPQVVEELFKKGLQVVSSLKGIKNGIVIISSHGAPIEVLEEIKKRKINLIDATCPFVKYAQNIVRRLKREGYRIIIMGDKAHPEVKALKSLTLPSPINGRGKKIGIVSQTTQNKENYIKEIGKILEEDFSEIRIFNTICNDTLRRQLATRALLKDCDLIIVIGGKNSANTRRLWQICKESGVGSFHIETESELKREWFAGKRRVGITSGASTPDSMVENVRERIKKFNKGTL